MAKSSVSTLRRNGAQMFHYAWQDIKDVIDILEASRPAQAEADARARLLAREADGRQHVRGLERARRACGPRRARHALQVQGDHESFAVNAVKAEVGGRGQATLRIAVHRRRRNPVEDALLQAIAYSAPAGGLFVETLAGERSSPTESDDPGHIFRAGTPIAFVVPPVKQRPQRRSLADVQRSHALRPVEFVGGERGQIEAQLANVDRNLAG